MSLLFLWPESTIDKMYSSEPQSYFDAVQPLSKKLDTLVAAKWFFNAKKIEAVGTRKTVSSSGSVTTLGTRTDTMTALSSFTTPFEMTGGPPDPYNLYWAPYILRFQYNIVYGPFVGTGPTTWPSPATSYYNEIFSPFWYNGELYQKYLYSTSNDVIEYTITDSDLIWKRFYQTSGQENSLEYKYKITQTFY